MFEFSCEVCDRPISRIESKCASCRKPHCARHRYSYVDGNNGAITRNAKEFCATCFKKNHPDQWY